MTRSRPSASSLGLIIRNLGGHEYGVRSVTFSPDGRSIASGSYDSTIRLWDADDPFPTPSANHHPFMGHTGAITSISYSSSGNMIASGSTDCTIRLWETASGRTVGRPLNKHIGYVNSVAFSPSANLVASGSADKTIMLWDTSYYDPQPTIFNGHLNWVNSIAFCRNGVRLVSGSHDKTIRVWDVERRTMIGKPYEEHSRAVLSTVFAPNGYQIASGSEDNTIRLWDIRSGKRVSKAYTGHTQAVCSLAFAPNGMYIASGCWDKTVRAWDVRNGHLLAEPFRRHTHWVNSVSFSPCSTRIVSGSEDRNVMIWRFLEDDSEEEGELPGSEAVDYHMSTLTSFNFGPPPTPLPTLDHFDLLPHRMEVRPRQMSSQEMFAQLVAQNCRDLSSEIDNDEYSSMAIHGGAMGDIYRGKLRDSTDIAVKVWRMASMPEGGSKHMKRAMREIYNWSKMKHENIQELMGIVLLHGRLGMVSIWMENGNLRDYIRKNRDCDRYSLCSQVASGVSYLHMEGMVHGDLKAVNVLVSMDGIVKISDFDHSILSESSLIFSETTNRGGGTLRWMAPELLLEGNIAAERSRECDVYALGMTILEIITGKLPYIEYQRDQGVLGALYKKKPPKQPGELSGTGTPRAAIWRTLLTCWDHDPTSRPTAYQIWQFFKNLVY